MYNTYLLYLLYHVIFTNSTLMHLLSTNTVCRTSPNWLHSTWQTHHLKNVSPVITRAAVVIRIWTNFSKCTFSASIRHTWNTVALASHRLQDRHTDAPHSPQLLFIILLTVSTNICSATLLSNNLLPLHILPLSNTIFY